MNQELKKYTEAVAKRKAINRKMSGQTVNYAIVSQLENNDIPRLLEIIRVQDEALAEIIRIGDLLDKGDEDEHYGVAVRGRFKVEELASAGSSAKWGEHES